MSDTASSSGAEPHEEPKRLSGAGEGDEPLWVRLLYMIGFGFLGNFALSIVLVLAALQFVVVLLRGSVNDELKGFSRNLTKFVWECLSYVTFNTDDKPFPFSRFPDESAG